MRRSLLRPWTRAWCAVIIVVLLNIGAVLGEGALVYPVKNFPTWWDYAIGTGVLLEVHDQGRVWRGSADDLLRLMFPLGDGGKVAPKKGKR